MSTDEWGVVLRTGGLGVVFTTAGFKMVFTTEGATLGVVVRVVVEGRGLVGEEGEDNGGRLVSSVVKGRRCGPRASV